MLVHARRQLYRSRRLAAVCFRLLAAPAECSVGDPEEKTGQKFTNTKDDRFIDKIRIRATGGLGGTGCDSYIKRSRKGIVRPIPDGGHGGQGGDVIVEACSLIRDLRDVRFTQRAGAGGPGGSQRRTGVRGQDRIITVPVGTCVSRSSHLLEQDTDELLRTRSGDSSGHGARSALPGHGAVQHLSIADLDAAAVRILVAQGGPGGRGSISAYRGDDIARTEAKKGRSGDEVLLQLELKLLADVGFVGMPNVGKSTLLRALTNAKPKVANYPFTTLQPQLGILEYGQRQIVLADIPGLIPGAAQNRGRGFAFLRHVERTRMLAYVLDLSSKPGPSPLQQLADLQTEVEQYSLDLPQKTTMIVGNKVDQVGEESEGLRDRLEAATGIRVHLVSARYGQGLECFREALGRLACESRDL